MLDRLLSTAQGQPSKFPSSHKKIAEPCLGCTVSSYAAIVGGTAYTYKTMMKTPGYTRGNRHLALALGSGLFLFNSFRTYETYLAPNSLAARASMSGVAQAQPGKPLDVDRALDDIAANKLENLPPLPNVDPEPEDRRIKLKGLKIKKVEN